ncbi:MAG: hypothetical protein MJ126_05745 [Lachnospiraceae bacterium]|nr:hypothetical protein [Lachnospiraceae bacterium]
MKEYPRVTYDNGYYVLDNKAMTGAMYREWCKLKTYWLDGELYHSGKKCCDCKKGKISRKEIV